MIIKLHSKNGQYPDLSPEQEYIVIEVEADDFRILNDQGRPYLYSHDLFEIVDSRESEDWITEVGEDGERYAYPPSLNQVGFFEDFFDTRQETVATFWHVVNQRLAMATAAI